MEASVRIVNDSIEALAASVEGTEASLEVVESFMNAVEPSVKGVVASIEALRDFLYNAEASGEASAERAGASVGTFNASAELLELPRQHNPIWKQWAYFEVAEASVEVAEISLKKIALPSVLLAMVSCAIPRMFSPLPAER